MRERAAVPRSLSPVPSSRRGFTLVELMTVVLIIGILAGLIAAAGLYARAQMRAHAALREIQQFSHALESYRNKYGEYPPDFTGINSTDSDAQTAARNAVIRHMVKRWPRAKIGTWAAFRSAVAYASSTDSSVTLASPFQGRYVDVNQLGPAEALVFWLGGLPDYGTGSTRLMGFSADEANPFTRGGSRTSPLYEFDDTRLVPQALPASGHFAYRLQGRTGAPGEDTVAPLVYFRARSVPDRTRAYQSDQTWTWTAESSVTVQPYFDVPRNRYHEPDGYQILCAGLDNRFGAKYQLPLDQGTATADGFEFDNLTSFAEGQLGDLSE